MANKKITEIIKKVLPAVVSISEIIGDKKNKPYFFKSPIENGTGFIASREGIVLSDAHIVSNPKEKYRITLNNDRQFEGKVLFIDVPNDITALKISARNLPFIPLADSSKIELGEDVLAIGNVLGLFSNTVTKGIVSGFFRNVSAFQAPLSSPKNLQGLIQTDAAINPGNSGGPLINLEGKAVGINVVSALGMENLGFAIPSNIAKIDLEEFKKFGKIKKPFVGIKYSPINNDLSKSLNLPVSRGIYIFDSPDSIIKNSPAEKAGLKPGDIILKCDNQEITPEISFEEILQTVPVSQKIELLVLRKNKKIKIKLELGENS